MPAKLNLAGLIRPIHPVKARTQDLLEEDRRFRSQQVTTQWWRRKHKGETEVRVKPGTFWNRARRRHRARVEAGLEKRESTS